MDLSAVQYNFKGIIDSTLREGWQFRDADFTLSQQRKIVRYLSKIGIDYIELGNPINSQIAFFISNLMAEQKPSSKILTHIRNKKSDVSVACSLGVAGVNILCTADCERLDRMNHSLETYLQTLKEHIQAAQEHNLEVRISVEDFFNQSLENAIQIFKTAENMGVDRVGIADTLGSASNWEVFSKIQQLRQIIHTDIEVHFHNDFGMATSNAIWALAAGANWVDTTLLGIGERTGITSLSSLLTNLYLPSPALIQKYNLEYLTDAENFVADICHIQVPFNAITNRDNAFAHKAGIHLDALIKHGPEKYEPFAPSIIGNSRKLITGTVISGKTTEAQVEKFYKLHGK